MMALDTLASLYHARWSRTVLASTVVLLSFGSASNFTASQRPHNEQFYREKFAQGDTVYHVVKPHDQLNRCAVNQGDSTRAQILAYREVVRSIPFNQRHILYRPTLSHPKGYRPAIPASYLLTVADTILLIDVHDTQVKKPRNISCQP